ncbi:CPBP family intramembrane metalloprotease [Sulfitobacter mediterraneus]|uniref:CAAX protease n=1 Tax=Sulfitobacter mediterraneus TaxID=83219 RepID=A0A061SV37_9RHOB|nr:CPBP family intramembrane glutamic endopeptidase [Sulfitobacter mediterraneus]KAJ03618.1 CAAX protease [Sulfitobacter mediterraneus]MBM1308861.1 CPBP family intramembrane metalloprotease [Sulfitobacter mediterraneus]MBM1312746.1 CPBP family intramembrane metalloprotease [Sulfitobacter mediterraneus]MBM1321128.1 CPBP family intramembrane metalloprotease [Sulfitobacter mediterraneus]MBM1325015.1 CPBP family intramembrane metalloprotease [Sulfitobacter mediterraneus]
MSPNPAYALHEIFIAPARKKPALWRLLAGLTLAVVGYVALNQMFFQLVYGLAGDGAYALYNELSDGTTPRAMLLLLFSFGFMAMAVGISVRLLHSRSMMTLLGPLKLALTDFRAVSLAMIALGVLLVVLPPWDMGGTLSDNMPFGQWMVLLPFSLLGVLVQVSAEELVFRGYIQQQLAARFRSPVVWMVLPSLLFAAGHYLPESAGENAMFIALWAGIFGMLMADLTARSGSLGPAIAVHLWNNVTAILIVSLPDDLSGLSLYHSPFGMADADAVRAWLPVDFALMFVSWLAARVAIRR